MFRSILKRFKLQIIFATILSSISAISGVFMLSMITNLIGNYEDGVEHINYGFVEFLAIVVLVVATGVYGQYILVKLSSSVVYEIQIQILKNALETKYEVIERLGGHRLIATLEDDVGALAGGILTVPVFVYNLVSLIIGFGYLTYISYQLFLFVLMVILFLIFIALKILAVARIHQKLLREYIDSFYKNMRALTNGGKELCTSPNRRNYYFFHEMVPLFRRIREKTVQSEILFIVLDKFSSTLFFLLIGSIIFGAHLITKETDASVVVAFVLMILYLVNPITQLANTGETINRVRIAQSKIEQLDLGDSSYRLSVSHNNESKHWSKITVKNLTYKFKKQNDGDERPFSVGPISLEIQSGETTFITGGNGSGKSTFAKLITGLYVPDSGEILLDGSRLGTDISMLDYSQNITAIFTDFYVFEQLLDSNGKTANDDKVADYLLMLELDNKVSTKNGLLTKIALSSGQRKRLALLQSFLDDKQICIFDEVAADQDPVFKEYFYKQILLDLKRLEKFVIVITHDDNYFSIADQILYFREGEIIVNRV